MVRFVFFILALMSAAASWAAPQVVKDNSNVLSTTYNVYFRASDTNDSEAMAVNGSCSVRFVVAGSDAVSLYAIPTPSTAAASGTLIRAFTASTTTTAYTFSPGTRFVKLKPTTAATGGSEMILQCSPILGSGGSAGGTYFASNYAAGSNTGGIQDAIDDCESRGGGVVVLPNGVTTIDATNLSSPIISLPDSTIATGHMALCDLVGYGGRAGTGTSAVGGGSDIVVTNSGTKVVMRVSGEAQNLSDFTLKTPGITSGGIALQFASNAESTGCPGATPCVLGQFGINNASMRNVGLAGTANGTVGNGEGTGLQLQFALKNHFQGGAIQGFENGIDFADVAANTEYLQSNANLFEGIKIRENDIGIKIHNTTGANPDNTCTDLTLVGNTIEGNQVGMSIAASECRVADISNHWENGCVAGCAGAINIRMDTVGGSTPEASQLTSINSFFGGVSAGLDIVRNYYNSGWRPDLAMGSFFTNGVTYSNSSEIKSMPGTVWFADGAASATGTYTVVPTWTDCPSHYGGTATTEKVAGDTCYDKTANILWTCEPGADGVCDSAAEWIATAGSPTVGSQSGTSHSPTAALGDFAGRMHRYTNTGNITVSLPTVDSVGDGQKVCFYDDAGSGAASLLTIDPDNGDAITLNGTQDTDGDSIDTDTAADGDYVCLVSYEGGSSDTWFVLDRSGTWAAN